ncbi:DNA-processing protein DprA [Pedobacter chitinilyticus]|uniref:DNA-protecting protein DprA n=1 Tax=Pedobacter chitinilyticus TaxID=2233776 RepID=A0A443YM53_9SPHI|nr:DNA-processing protein DprA [Pedobacter chitinilyticus]RWU04847.1 DNA-protecting protein DprA [Pedobacter chitinilyticus]
MSKQHQIALTLIEGVGPLIAKKLLQHFGSAAQVFNANQKQLLQIDGIGKKTAEAILQTNALALAEKELEFIEKHQIKVLFYENEDYPKRLKSCYDAPLLLYYKGTADLNASKIVSIVGTRNATAYGKMLCKQLIEVLKPYDVLMVSGLAHGIDAAAHKESLLHEMPTIGVLGHGLDRVYPAAHRELAAKMLKCGGLLTEFLPGTNPDRENFPKRNRIIAGMADVTIVVEASIKGGALITAEIANSYNRDVYAFPGRINDEFSEGCNFLIKTNRAGLINNPQDLIYYLGWDDNTRQNKSAVQAQLPLNLNNDERTVCNALLQAALPVDELALKTNIAQSKLAVILLTLEMKGIIVALPGKLFKLV